MAGVTGQPANTTTSRTVRRSDARVLDQVPLERDALE